MSKVEIKFMFLFSKLVNISSRRFWEGQAKKSSVGLLNDPQRYLFLSGQQMPKLHNSHYFEFYKQ